MYFKALHDFLLPRRVLSTVLLLISAGAAAATPFRSYNSPGPQMCLPDSLPKTRLVTVIVPFEYKRSALYSPPVLGLVDSVATLLQHDPAITYRIWGYSYYEEGTSEVCYWLSRNRALAVQAYIAGRGIDSTRLLQLDGRGNKRSLERHLVKASPAFNWTAEITLQYPLPPPPKPDADGDGIPDDADHCPTIYGYPEQQGCRDSNIVIVPFDPGQSYLSAATYHVMDSLLVILKKDTRLRLAITGHAYPTEGFTTTCLAAARADMVRKYLLSRYLAPARIVTVTNLGTTRPISAGRNPLEIAVNSRAEIRLISPSAE